jgi:hypothetical protein
MTETLESRIEARLSRYPEAYAEVVTVPLGRGELARVPEAILISFRNIASQPSLEGLTYSLTTSIPYLVVTAASLSGRSAYDVAVDVRKRASGWLSLTGVGERATSRMMASGLQAIYEMGVGSLARLGVRAYRWEADQTAEAAGHLVKIAGVTLATALYFEAVARGLRPRGSGQGEQLTLF